MSQDRIALETILNRLYRRIDTPYAGDLAALRIGLKIAKRLGGKPEPAMLREHPLHGLSQAKVREGVEDGSIDAAEALAYEMEQEKPRAKITAWLQERLADKEPE